MRISNPTSVLVLVCLISCYPSYPTRGSSGVESSRGTDSVAALRLFEENIDAIHKRNRARYLATYLQTPFLARNGPAGLQVGFSDWAARRDTTWPDTLRATHLRVVPVGDGIVYGSYCYTVTQKDTTTSGVSERLFLKTPAGWRIAVTSAFGLPAGEPAQCK